MAKSLNLIVDKIRFFKHLFLVSVIIPSHKIQLISSKFGRKFSFYSKEVGTL